ncbi:unnamed protein product [Euphydryas editha]|uniref:Uncharacterized protein n=1 Tax=Euphydryas editha TaxID=104508 RepID=A0AAU9TW49_EUPED|nr:unnamed protein product [Euphydryas editha]
MEECKKRAHGTKVSKIANIFQGMPSRDDEDMRGSDVTVVRTESHLARFNNARALFEKLGEENRNFRIEKSPSAAASFAGTRGIPVIPSRSRSSSAGSVSPTRNNAIPASTLAPAVNGDRLSNGATQQLLQKPVKPSVLPKPEKPDRRFNKELIEKQRNWTAHFNKSRPNRYEQEQRLDYKSTVGYQDRKSPEVSDRHVPSRVYSPPLSPGAGDSHIERPSTLPCLVNRSIHVAKSSSPVKNIAPVLPSPRSNNNISSNTRSEFVSSTSIKRDISSSPQTPQNAELLERKRLDRVSISLESEKGKVEKIDELVPRTENNLPITKIAESTILPVQTSTAPDIIGVESPKYPKLPPSPPVRAPKSPPPPIPIENKLVSETVIAKCETVACESTTKEKEEKENDNVDTPHENIEKSPPYIPSFVNDRINENNVDNTETSTIVTPDVCDIVLRSPSKVQDEDVYEALLYSGDWNEKNKRRSSTPESPIQAVPDEDPPRSPLATPLASPVHSLPYSSSPAPTSPLQGELFIMIIVI